ncbi:hypothetical protein ACQ4LE_000058 [Meloidogyne hapla]
MTNNENRKIVVDQNEVFIWELMDVTNIIPNNHPDKIRLEVFLDGSLNVLLKYGFNLDNFNDFDQSNIMDGQQGVVEKTENWKAKTRRSPAFLKQSTSTQNINPINLPYVPFPSSYLYSAPPAAIVNVRALASKCGNIQDYFDKYKTASEFSGKLQLLGINPREFFTWLDVFEDMPEATYSVYRDCLKAVDERGHINVILSYPFKATVAGALGRLLLSIMGQHVHAENVFCAPPNLRGNLFGRLAQQFKSKKGSMIYVTTNDENKELAEEYGIKCLILESKDALIKLRNNLDGSDQTICELAKFVAKF